MSTHRAHKQSARVVATLGTVFYFCPPPTYRGRASSTTATGAVPIAIPVFALPVRATEAKIDARLDIAEQQWHQRLKESGLWDEHGGAESPGQRSDRLKRWRTKLGLQMGFQTGPVSEVGQTSESSDSKLEPVPSQSKSAPQDGEERGARYDFHALRSIEKEVLDKHPWAQLVEFGTSLGAGAVEHDDSKRLPPEAWVPHPERAWKKPADAGGSLGSPPSDDESALLLVGPASPCLSIRAGSQLSAGSPNQLHLTYVFDMDCMARERDARADAGTEGHHHHSAPIDPRHADVPRYFPNFESCHALATAVGEFDPFSAGCDADPRKTAAQTRTAASPPFAFSCRYRCPRVRDPNIAGSGKEKTREKTELVCDVSSHAASDSVVQACVLERHSASKSGTAANSAPSSCADQIHFPAELRCFGYSRTEYERIVAEETEEGWDHFLTGLLVVMIIIGGWAWNKIRHNGAVQLAFWESGPGAKGAVVPGGGPYDEHLRGGDADRKHARSRVVGRGRAFGHGEEGEGEDVELVGIGLRARDEM